MYLYMCICIHVCTYRTNSCRSSQNRRRKKMHKICALYACIYTCVYVYMYVLIGRTHAEARKTTGKRKCIKFVLSLLCMYVYLCIYTCVYVCMYVPVPVGPGGRTKCISLASVCMYACVYASRYMPVPKNGDCECDPDCEHDCERNLDH